MSESLPSPTREEFAQWIQDALPRLYDSPYLRTRPLVAALAGAEHDTLRGIQQLRRMLLDAIQALSPSADAPAQAADWRAYRILELRYIEGLSPAEVMKELALSRSHYFREQARMLDALTATLWDEWQQTNQPPPAATSPDDGTREQMAQAAIERLSAHATWEAIDPVQVLEQLRPIVDSLARAQGVAVQFNLPQHLIVLHADRVLLRQALFNVMTYAVDVAVGGQVQISSFAEGHAAGISVLALAPATATPPADTPERQGIGLDVSRGFMAAMGGMLEVHAVAYGCWEARLVWPAAAARTLLVIDDNQDFADLFRRYLAGHNWQVVGAADGAQARRVLAEVAPTVIVLDVMMPREDGWELLVALRSNETTRDTPIIICSVLNEPRLAQTLGATGYLSKPVTQPALLRALAPWNQAGASPEPAR